MIEYMVLHYGPDKRVRRWVGTDPLERDAGFNALTDGMVKGEKVIALASADGVRWVITHDSRTVKEG